MSSVKIMRIKRDFFTLSSSVSLICLQNFKNFGEFLLFTSPRQLHILYYKSRRLYSDKTDRFLVKA